MGQLLTQRYKASRTRSQEEKDVCGLLGERKEVKEKGCSWLRHRDLKYPYLHIQGMLLSWNIKQGPAGALTPKTRLCQIMQGPVYQAKEIRYQL